MASGITRPNIQSLLGKLSDYITSKQILKQCFDIVRLCDCVLVTTDPTESEGVNAEIDKAMEYGIEVLHVWQQAEHQWPQTISEGIKCIT